MMGSGNDIRPAFAMMITLVIFAVAKHIFAFPDLPNDWGHFWVALAAISIGGLWLVIWHAMIWIGNYFYDYKDEQNPKCRIFGHDSKRIRMAEHGPSVYRCKRCDKEYDVYDGGM
jgi:hypothetical protein